MKLKLVKNLNLLKKETCNMADVIADIVEYNIVKIEAFQTFKLWLTLNKNFTKLWLLILNCLQNSRSWIFKNFLLITKSYMTTLFHKIEVEPQPLKAPGSYGSRGDPKWCLSFLENI